jgi:hypothetical protein
MGMWAFLGSGMFFGSLSGRTWPTEGKSISGPTPHDVFDIR